MHSLKLVFCIVLLVFIFLPSAEALAYLDPGTGSMILQLILGGVAGVSVVIKMYWQRIKNIFHRKIE